MRCGCEVGGDCTKTTVCAVESAVEDVTEELTSQVNHWFNEGKKYAQIVDELTPVVEAACAFVDLQQAAHHGPIKNETKIRVRAELYNAVMNYQENQQ